MERDEPSLRGAGCCASEPAGCWRRLAGKGVLCVPRAGWDTEPGVRGGAVVSVGAECRLQLASIRVRIVILTLMLAGCKLSSLRAAPPESFPAGLSADDQAA